MQRSCDTGQKQTDVVIVAASLQECGDTTIHELISRRVLVQTFVGGLYKAIGSRGHCVVIPPSTKHEREC